MARAGEIIRDVGIEIRVGTKPKWERSSYMLYLPPLKASGDSVTAENGLEDFPSIASLR